MNNLIVGERYTWFHKRTNNSFINGWEAFTEKYCGNEYGGKYYIEPGFTLNTHVIVEFLGYIDTPDKKGKMCSVKVVNKKGEEIQNGEVYNSLVEECLKKV